MLLLSLLFLPSFERKPPEVLMPEGSLPLGKRASLALKFLDKPSGLREARVLILQGGKVCELYLERFPRGQKEREVRLSVEPQKLGLKEGEARLLVRVRDFSLWNFGRGNRTVKEAKVLIDLTPPEVELLASTRYVYQNGSGAVLLRVSADAVKAGVKVGNCFFRAYPEGKGKPLWRGLFGIPFYAGGGKARVVAWDRAGNEASWALPYVPLRRPMKRDVISLSDTFIQTKIYPLLPPEKRHLSPEEAFEYVNEQMRRQNDQFLRKVASSSLPEPLWEGAFLQFPNSKVMATFGDRRTYLYKGKVIGHSVHLALDLASVPNAPVPAANRGIVIFAGPVGIYGNVVILDHGLGLMTLYAHLSRWTVRKGQEVKKGQVIGYTGATGFAGGDHLHFAVMLSGYPVDPIDWLDPKWMRERILPVFGRA